jgi:hypothetical protein
MADDMPHIDDPIDDGDPIFVHQGHLYVCCEDGQLTVFAIEPIPDGSFHAAVDGAYMSGSDAPPAVTRAGIRMGIAPEFFGVKKAIPRVAPRYIVGG